MTTFFTSDEHYGHANIIKYTSRPFASVEEQTETLIENFNSKVGPQDHTWHLGDILWRTVPVNIALHGILGRLHGTHSLILGNHDQLTEGSTAIQSFFREIRDLKELRVMKDKVLVLCHYAMRVWPNSHRGSWHLYGHSHGELDELGKSFDVGVDSAECGFFPLALDEVAAKMDRREPHHVITKVWPGKELPVAV